MALKNAQDRPPSVRQRSRIVGSGLMADHIRAFDWSVTPLGAIERWSDVLISTVNQLLCTPSPATLLWGEAFTFFYNDAAIPTLTHKHPGALGSPYPNVFAEAWHLVELDVTACYVHGQTAVRENVLIPILEDGEFRQDYWTYSLIPIYEQGRIAGIFNPHSNVTEAVRAPRERDAATERLQQFLSATSDAVVGVDREWNISYLNPTAQKIYGAGRDLVGKSLWDEFPSAVYDGSPFVATYTRAMNEGVAGSFEAHYPDPLNIWLQLEVYPTTEGIVTFSRDVTTRKQTAASLLQTEKLAAVGRLAASIAHEINNPLESVTNLLYLARTTAEPSELDEYLEAAERELRRVSAISNQTLRFHRQSSNPTAVTCEDMFVSVLSIYQGRLLNSGVQLEKRKRAHRSVECFDGEIRQVLNNLVGNAIDAMPGGGRLLVRSREAHNWQTGQAGLMLTVADTGVGMSAQVLAQIFEAFYTTKGIGGTGLGLWVSKEIVDRHHGTLRVRSAQRQGSSGTVFVLFLPFKAALR